MNTDQKQPPQCSSKQVLLKILQISQENTCVGSLFNKVAVLLESLFDKVAGLQTSNCFPAKFAKFKNTYFEEHLRTNASDGRRPIFPFVDYSHQWRILDSILLILFCLQCKKLLKLDFLSLTSVLHIDALYFCLSDDDVTVLTI